MNENWHRLQSLERGGWDIYELDDFSKLNTEIDTMADLGGFTATEVEPPQAFKPLPAGDYRCIIEHSEMKPTKNGNGEMLVLRLKVLDGDFKNRVLFDRLNLKNPSEQAVQIARGTLSAICRAVGVLTPGDSSELHNKPLVAVVMQREYNGNQQNEIKGYKEAKPVAKEATGQTVAGW